MLSTWPSKSFTRKINDGGVLPLLHLKTLTTPPVDATARH
jgi:phosphoketolase